jgi:hypothetical protein
MTQAQIKKLTPEKEALILIIRNEAIALIQNLKIYL